MDSAAATLARLFDALESLTHEEHHLLDQERYTEALAVQSREVPLVKRIAALLGQPGIPASLAARFRPRAQRLIEAQQRQSDRLGKSMAETREQLDQIRLAELRAAKLRPSYGAESSALAPRLSFVAQG